MSTPETQRLQVSTPIKALHLSVSRCETRCWASLFYTSKARPSQMLAYASGQTLSNARVERIGGNGWALWIGDMAFDIAAKDAPKVAAFLDCQIEESAV